jgi:hypothetical protein
MADNKTKPTQLSVATCIDAVTDENRRADAKALVKLMHSVTGEEPKMWGPSIIGFGSHHYKYESGREGDMPLVGFSPRKAATVLYGVAGSSTLPARVASTSRNSPTWIKRCWRRWWSNPSPLSERGTRVEGSGPKL